MECALTAQRVTTVRKFQCYCTQTPDSSVQPLDTRQEDVARGSWYHEKQVCMVLFQAVLLFGPLKEGDWPLEYLWTRLVTLTDTAWWEPKLSSEFHAKL